MTFLRAFLLLSDKTPDILWNILLASIAILSGLLIKRLISFLLKSLTKKNDNHNFILATIKRLGPPINLLLPVLMVEGFLPFMRLGSYIAHVEKVLEIAVYISLSFVLIRCVLLFEDYVDLHFELFKSDNLKERKIRTQIVFIRKFAVLVIVILTIAAVLLSFESLRRIGAGLLTGVGIGGIIIGFAAQKSLGNLLAGFQIAFTQPIRIDDVLVVEGEYGRVEDITLTYVVLKIWDERRLILPITYFVEKHFYNWTRTSSQLTGTVTLYLDYSVPLDLLRAYFFENLANEPLWDRRARNLQVTDTKERTIEVRALVTARTSSDLFDLRCKVREDLICYIRLNFPGSLPQIRLGENAQVNIGSGNLIDRADKGSSSETINV